MAWNAAQVPGASLEIVEEARRGSHFMFIENSAQFNRVLAAFVG